MTRKVRELHSDDIETIVQYFYNADRNLLETMGVDRKKFPAKTEWEYLLHQDLNLPIQSKNFFFIIWELNEIPVGHSNINKIVFGKEAYMHLHLWNAADRKSGNGTFFLKNTISHFFQTFELTNLYCEPKAENSSPNKTLEKMGFELTKTYETTPGWLNFHQTVNKWVLSKEKWLKNSNDNKTGVGISSSCTLEIPSFDVINKNEK